MFILVFLHICDLNWQILSELLSVLHGLHFLTILTVDVLEKEGVMLTVEMCLSL